MRGDSNFAQRVKNDFGARIINLGTKNWKQQLFRSLEPPFIEVTPSHPYAGQYPLGNLLDLAKDKLGALTAVIEPYISTDWNSERSSVYSRTFQDTSQVTQRIHFFAAVVRYKDLYEIPKKLRRGYLGYTVIRPLQAFRVCDTVLASPCIIGTETRNIVHCLEKFQVSLLGNHLRVIGMPFFQQETTVGVCAEADIWMLARYLNKKGDTRRYRPAEVTSLAHKTITTGPARAGLFELQIMDALRQMGLNPAIFYPTNPLEAKEFIYTCIESELPVITGVPQHVFVVIGHGDPGNIEFNKETALMSETISSFIIHDDALGPYMEQQTGEITSTVGHDEITLLELGGRTVDFFMVAFPPRVHMYGHEALQIAKLWIKEINNYVAELLRISPKSLWQPKELKKLVLRTYLRLSSDFKSDILNPQAEMLRNDKIIAKYKCMQMPKYVWVVEIGQSSDWEGISLKNRKIRGEIILDATGSRHVPEEALMAFHLNGIMFIPGRKGQGDELIVEDEQLYTPLRRTIRQEEIND